MNIKQKIVFWTLLALLCLPQAAAWTAAKAEGPQVELYGLVTEVLDGGILLADERLGEVLLNVDTETVLEGILAETPLEKGMYVYAKYNGILTRSQPPQTHADRLGCYTLDGTVSQVLDGQVLLSGDKIFGDAVVRLGSHQPHVLAGVPITVYYNGTMAMSMPPQVSASYVVVPVITGTVKKVSEDSFSLATQDQQLYTVKVDGLTLLPSSWFEGRLEGKTVTVYHDGNIEEGGILRSLEVVDPSSIVQEPTPMPTPEPTGEEPDAPTPSPEPSRKPEPIPTPDPSLAPTVTPGPSAAPTEIPDASAEPTPTATPDSSAEPTATPEAASNEILESLPSPTPVMDS